VFPSLTITPEAALRDLTSSKSRAREEAALALGDVTDPAFRERAVSALIERLKDPQANVRSAACSSLGELKGDRAVSALIEVLDDPVAGTRQHAAIALGTTKSALAFQPLCRALESGFPDLRFQAATSLCEIDSRRALPYLLRAMDDDDPFVLSQVALALGAVGDACAIPPLRDALERLSDGPRFDVAYALARLGDARALPTLENALEQTEHAWDAIDAIELLNDPAAADMLARFLENGRRPREHRLRAAGALVRIAPAHRLADASRAELLRALTALRFHIRAQAVSELGKIAEDFAVAALTRLRERPAGKHLQDEINEALTRIQGRR
jgi:HEAT repeat protein